MKARCWMVLVLGAITAAPAFAAVGNAGGFSEAAFVFAGTSPSQFMVVNGFGAHALSARDIGAHDFGALAAEPASCDLGNCARLYATAFGGVVDRPVARDADASSSADDDSDRMTGRDFALMMLFALALVAYQLDRKQRVLRQSSLSELSV